jgi:M3 family oligoendopeptidase
MSTRFPDMQVVPASLDEVKTEYEAIHAAFDGATDADGRVAALRQWDALRRRLETWGALVNVHFTQDTRDEARKKARESYDEQAPTHEQHRVEMLRKLLASPHRAELEGRIGKHAFALWEAAVTTFDPAIADDLVEESRLSAKYTELCASAALDFDGETHNLSTIRKYGQHPDRELRKGADAVTWAFFAENGDEFDRIFDELVKLRHGMARKLGFENYIGLGYKRMGRTDWGQKDVEKFRAAVLEHVVPLASRIRTRQAEVLGVDRLRYYDEALFDPEGNPAPKGDEAWMVERATELFDEMGSGLGGFFRMMNERGLLDLDSRPGKGGGGYCTDLIDYRVPFIFANFNGTHDDVRVFTHEMGHAFQGYSSREKFPMDCLWPTAEACEIHSMSLEYLTWPGMDKFFGEKDAERFRRQHLTGSLLFFPYGVCGDHFQHLVYENPEATPAERHGMWSDLEKTYLPWRDYDGQARGELGGLWQRQLHNYLYPLYYVDYALAEVCAQQFWLRARADQAEALEGYVALCRRGGEAPFTELVKGAGLKSPFEAGSLEGVVAEAARYLGY